MRWLWLIVAAKLVWAQHEVVPADIEEGARNFSVFCAACHGPDGNAMTGADLTRPNLRNASTDEQVASVIQSGIRGTGMPPHNVNQRQLFTLVQFVRSLSRARSADLAPGDAGKGRAIFDGKGQCLTCHRVKDRGSYAGPNLTDIGILRRTADLQESLLNPASIVLPQNSMVTATAKDGTTVRGRLLNADTHYVQLVEANGQLRNIARETLASYTQDVKTSAMPSYRDRLTREEVADVVAYLATLRGN